MRVCPSCTRLLASDRCPSDGSKAAAVEALPEGTRVGPYTIIEPIGRGGMGHVYEAVHGELERRVAIKFLRDELDDDELPARFLREARAVSRIDHDNVIKVYDYGDGTDGAVYFVMEMLDGETLWDLNRRSGRLDPALCRHIYDQILAALDAAHQQKVVHRDLKPTNVFIVERQTNPQFVKLLDFGLARLAGSSEGPRLTLEGTIMGTPEYMSPEQIEGKTADPRSDLYAVGVMLYESLTGAVPFPAAGTSFPALARRVLVDPPAPPSTLAPVSSGLEAIIMRALEKNPADRFASAAEMRAAFAEAAGDIGEPPERAREPAEAEPAAAPDAPLDSAPTIPSGVVESLRRSRSPWLIVGAVALLATAVGIVAAVIAAGDGEPEPPAAIDAGPKTVASLWASGDHQAARALARQGVLEALAATQPERAEATGLGVCAAATPAALRLLVEVLESTPAARGAAARAIAELRLFDGAPAIRDVLERSGKRLRLTLAGALLALGDRSAIDLLVAELASDNPASQLDAAIELLADPEHGAAARDKLQAIAAATPNGRERWLRANVALARRGDATARGRLTEALTQNDAGRAVTAAAALAPDSPDAAGYLERVVADPAFGARADAALALARLGRPGALNPVAELLEGSKADQIAGIATAARLGKRGGERYADRIAKLTDSAEPEVSAAARTALLAF